MRIAILASEAAPYIKSGGLGDVMEALPAALARIPGNQVLLIVPYYKKILENPAFEVEQVTQFQVRLGWRHQHAGVFRLKNPSGGVQVYFIDNLYYFGNRDGTSYGHGDDGERYAYFSRACLDALLRLAFRPDVILCNDWQTGLVPVYLAALYHPAFPGTKCIFTIHNVEYQGWADASFFDDVLSLPEAYRACLDFRGSVNVMKGAIETAHSITTVSETYSRQLTDPYYAHGMEDILSTAAHKLIGITNGIDTNTFDPQTDPALPANYSASSCARGKALCKAALQKEVGLPLRKNTPLLVMVSRLASHKGLDLLQDIAPRLLREQKCQLLILGTGEARYERFFTDLSCQFPQQVAAIIAFDLDLAARIYAGGDIYLMPSRSEPCGLSQMNAMRYGTIPVVHATGGLRDTVPPVDDQGLGGLGFTFQTYSAEDFYNGVCRCLKLYQKDKEAFQALRETCMSQDFGWDKPARQYMALFRNVLEQQ